MEISVVVPAYRCSIHIEELYNRLTSTLKKITEDFEIIFVNDKSPDDDWIVIKNIADKDNKVVGINFSRNYGQHYAITAGIDHASGNWVVVMDGDLQDKPEEIIRFYEKSQEGFDIVYGVRSNRNDSFFKKMVSKLFYSVLGYMTDTKQDSRIGNFGIYNKKVLDYFRGMRENLRFFPTMIKTLGFSYELVEVEHLEREGDKSSYNLKKMIKLTFEIIISFSDKPLRLTVSFGLFLSFLSGILAVYIFFRALFGEYKILGWPSMMVSIWFLSGIIIFILGTIGMYIGKIFDQVKGRPLYTIEEVINK